MNVAALRIATASLCLAVFLGGCATIPVGGPSSREVSAIKSGEAAIVLLRVQATENAMVRAVEIAAGAEPPKWPQNRAPSSELRAGNARQGPGQRAVEPAGRGPGADPAAAGFSRFIGRFSSNAGPWLFSPGACPEGPRRLSSTRH